MGKDLKGKELGKGITQRKDGRYSARFTTKSGKRIEFYNFKLAVVKKWLVDVAYEDEHGLLCDINYLTIDKWFWTWLDVYKKEFISDSTYKNYKNSYQRHIKPHIGGILLTKVKPIELQAILNEMYEGGYAYGTMNLAKITLHALFDGAIENNLIAKNPAQYIKCKQRDVEEKRVLTISEQQAFLEYAQYSMYNNAYKFALQTGMRVGELGGLFWSDIDFEKRTISIERTLLFAKDKGGYYLGKPKTAKSIRVIPMTDETINILNNQKILQFKLRAKSNNWNTDETFSDLVFTTTNGQPTSSSTYGLNMARIVTNINKDRRASSFIEGIDGKEYEEFKPLSMHTLRHTFATRCIENGMKPKTLQVLLGHSNLAITMDLYVHITDDEKHEEIKKVNANIKLA